MENNKIKFSELYENFTGSGNINGKYWIVGLESGGEVDFNNPEDEAVKALNSNNIFNIMEYFNDFNQETNNNGYLGLENKLLNALNMMDFHIIKYLEGKEYFHYPKYGQLFRTNLFMFNIKGTGKELNNSYESFIDIESNLERSILYNNSILKLRAYSLRQKINFDKPKIIIALIPYNYHEQFFEFFNSVFGTNFKDKVEKDSLHLNKYFITEYKSNNSNIRLIHIPQAFSLTQDHFNKIAQYFNL